MKLFSVERAFSIRHSNMTTTIEAPFTTTEEQEARQLNEKITSLLSSITGLEKSLMQGWATLSSHLFEVRERKFWILYGYESFGKYIVEVGDKIGKGRSQLYQGIRVVEQLPEVSAEDLTAIGISKAAEVCKIKAAGKSVPKDLIERAKKSETTIDQVREEVFNTLHSSPEQRGRYFDLSGFFVTPEEKEEILTGFDIARRVDPAIPHDIPEHAQRKEVMLRLVREFRSTYEALVIRGEG